MDEGSIVNHILLLRNDINILRAGFVLINESYICVTAICAGQHWASAGPYRRFSRKD